MKNILSTPSKAFLLRLTLISIRLILKPFKSIHTLQHHLVAAVLALPDTARVGE